MQIVEPDLVLNTSADAPSMTTLHIDAGDSINITLHVAHSGITAYRVKLTVPFPPEYFILDSNNTFLYINGALQPGSVTVDAGSSTVTAGTDILVSDDDLVAIFTLIASNNVENSDNYTIPYSLEWHSLPYGADGGRHYSTSGERNVTIKSSELSMDYSTSDDNTPGAIVQIQEMMSVNVSVILPEVSQFN